MGRELLVINPGPSSLIQDGGRPGLARWGVARSGAADRVSYAQANAVVGNHPGTAAIEHLLGGLRLRAVGEHWLAVAGAPMVPRVNGVRAAHRGVIRLRDGDEFTLDAASVALRGYVAVRGGVTLDPVLGSRSTDTLSGIGPAPLEANQRLPIGPVTEGPLIPDPLVALDPFAGWPTTMNDPVTLKAVLGPRDGRIAHASALAQGVWLVSDSSSRVAVRLARPPSGVDGEVPGDGPAPSMAWEATRELDSEGLVRGSVQLPPSGLPVVFLADHPVTGGYPVIAVLLDAETDRAAQLRPGQRLRFAITAGPVWSAGSSGSTTF